MGQMSNFRAVAGLERLAERLLMLINGLRQHAEQALDLLFAEQRTVGLQQRPVHARVFARRVDHRCPLGQCLTQAVQLQRLGQDPLHARLQIALHQRRLDAGSQGQDPAVAVRSGAST
ncbi:hypothetical protein D3C84_900130 [compost metagenome]